MTDTAPALTSVALLDSLPDPGPVAVPSRVAFNGVVHHNVVNLKLGWSVEGASVDGTVLRLFVDPAVLRIHPDGYIESIAGLNVLTPVVLPAWRTVHLTERDTRDGMTYPGYFPDQRPARRDWAEVFLFVAAVTVGGLGARTAGREPGDRVLTGGVLATVVECDVCRGTDDCDTCASTGMVIQPDQVAAP
jgi:hypothetical protein